MPSKPRSQSARFWRRLRWSVPVALLLWLLLRPAYNTFLAWSAEKLCRIWETPAVTRVVVEGDKAVIGREDMRTGSGWLGYSLTQIHFNLIPTLALILALPGWHRQEGWQKLVWALTILVVSHVLGLVFHIQYFFATSLGPWSVANYSEFSRNLYGFFQYFFDIPLSFTLPLLLWAGLYWEDVLSLVGLSPTSPLRPADHKS
ncbi:MAG: hypothetical protein NZ869_06275 [Thermoanaerobaculum sp.]|nr:hypothetical protein [Thermoanaerobaculum sp.]MDW7968376.1 hypothetical protein [Thermoanaerobaculum sp.]